VTPVRAIAAVAWRSAVRSRVLLSLAALVAVAAVGIPAVVRGDGTPAGDLRVALKYSLGAIRLLLFLAAVWAGCAAVAPEVESRRIQMVRSKPVGAFRLWLGHWLGLAALLALLLAAAGALAGGVAAWTVRPSRVGEAYRAEVFRTVLTSRRVARPEDPPGFEERLDRAVVEALETPEGARRGARAVRESTSRRLRLPAYRVAPGQAVSWRFAALPAAARAGATIETRAQSSHVETGVAPLRWTLLTADGDPLDAWTEDYVAGTRGLRILPPGRLPSGEDLVLHCENRSDAFTLFFDPDEGIQLLAGRGSFAANLARALLILFSDALFLAAAGVTLGCIFSMPVAAFASLFLLLLTGLSGYIGRMAARRDILDFPDGGAWPEALNAMLSGLFRALDFVLAPRRGVDPLELLATGRAVPWSQVGGVLLLTAFAASLSVGLLGAWVLSRRELALPGEV
jgi:hypothetical protein